MLGDRFLLEEGMRDLANAGYTVTEGAGKLGRSWLVHKDGVKVAEYPAYIAKKKVLGHHFYAVAAEVEKKAKRSTAAKAAAKSRAKSKDVLAALRDAQQRYGDLIDRAHHRREMQFHPLPMDAFESKDSILIHQSPDFGKKKGSTYRLVLVDGKPAYALASDHWGEFYTVERAFDDKDVLDGDKVYDDGLGRELHKRHEWSLVGHKPKPWGDERRVGYILLEDLEAV